MYTSTPLIVVLIIRENTDLVTLYYYYVCIIIKYEVPNYLYLCNIRTCIETDRLQNEFDLFYDRTVTMWFFSFFYFFRATLSAARPLPPSHRSKFKYF